MIFFVYLCRFILTFALNINNKPQYAALFFII